MRALVSSGCLVTQEPGQLFIMLLDFSLPKRFRPTAPSVNYLWMNEQGRIASKIFLINGVVTPSVNASSNSLDRIQQPTLACLSVACVLRSVKFLQKLTLKIFAPKCSQKPQQSCSLLFIMFFSGIIPCLFKSNRPTGKGRFLEERNLGRAENTNTDKTRCFASAQENHLILSPLLSPPHRGNCV